MKILFICNGNVARSQEAEIFFNSFSSDSHAESCGINVTPGKPIDPLVVTVMEEAGHDMSSATRKFISERLVGSADIIVSFKPKDELPEYLQDNGEIRYWNMPDPRQQTIEFHRKVRDDIKQKVRDLISEIESPSSDSKGVEL